MPTLSDEELLAASDAAWLEFRAECPKAITIDAAWTDGFQRGFRIGLKMGADIMRDSYWERAEEILREIVRTRAVPSEEKQNT